MGNGEAPENESPLDRVERVARFERGLNRLLETQARHEKRFRRHEERFRVIETNLGRIVTVFEGLSEKMAELIDVQRRTDERMAEMAQSISELSQSHKQTDEKLSALIHVVDDHIRRPPPPQ